MLTVHVLQDRVRERVIFSIPSGQNTSRPVGKMRTKEFETLYPLSTAQCVSQRPGPITPGSFPYLSLLPVKDKQNPKSSWFARCSYMKALLLSRPSLFIRAHKTPALTIHYLSGSMLLSHLFFSPLLSFSLPLRE